MPTMTDLVSEVQSLAHDITSRVETLDKEQKKLGEALTSKTAAMPAEYKETFDRLNARLNQIEDLIKEQRIAAQRPGSGSKAEKSAHRKAFLNAFRKHAKIELFTPEERSLLVREYMPAEQKDLFAGDATTGGFFADVDFINELQAYQLLISPMRKICRVQATAGEKVQMPALSQDTTAYWATEQSTFTTSQDPTLAMIEIPVFELRGLLRVSQQNLEDSMFDLETFLKERLGMNFAKKEGAAFINGTGSSQPRGILSYPIKASSSYSGGSAGKNNVIDSIAYVPTGQAANITADSILNVFMDLKSTYAPNSTYIMTRATLNTLRLFKDSQNRPLWQPFAASNLPSTIYDRPYVEMPDMPEIAAGAYPVLVGDFSNYMIVDRISLSIQQLNELYIASGLIGFIARMRVGGDVLIPEAFRALKVAVS